MAGCRVGTFWGDVDGGLYQRDGSEGEGCGEGRARVAAQVGMIGS